MKSKRKVEEYKPIEYQHPNAMVIEVGGQTTRVGFSGDMKPEAIFPTIVVKEDGK